MISFRAFRNTDPPAVAAIWNECFTGRGACILRMIAPLERAVFSKLFFDAKGLILAFDDATPVGFVHAGFGPNANQTDVDPATGVVCALGVRPAYRRRGVGSELLRQAEAYLRSRGATSAFAGTYRPFNPFYFSIYGGGDSPGLLDSDPMAAAFFETHGYMLAQQHAVMQRKLDQPIVVSDARFHQIRKRCEFALPKLDLQSWWLEGIVGAVEPLEVRLEDRTAGVTAGRAWCWEMEGFSWRWNTPAAGLIDLTIREDFRRAGLGRFFLAHVLRYLQDQYFGVCECQIDLTNIAARGLLESLGFSAVDRGAVFRKDLLAVSTAAAQDDPAGGAGKA